NSLGFRSWQGVFSGASTCSVSAAQPAGTGGEPTPASSRPRAGGVAGGDPGPRAKRLPRGPGSPRRQAAARDDEVSRSLSGLISVVRIEHARRRAAAGALAVLPGAGDQVGQRIADAVPQALVLEMVAQMILLLPAP